VHPSAEQACLKTISRILIQQWPGCYIHGESGIIGLWNSPVRNQQVAGHLSSLNLIGSADQLCREQEEQEAQAGSEHRKKLVLQHKGTSGNCFSFVVYGV
jgi:hypothetical protein